MPSTSTKKIRAKAIIFDLDGTMVDTTPLVERHWHLFAKENGLDGYKARSHGVRTMETFEKWAPHKATPEEVAEFEKKLADESDGISVLPGVSSLLEKIPSDKWGIYTGGTQYMAKKRLEQSKLPRPRTVICGDMLTKGKPDPAGYIRAAKEVGYQSNDVIVFEDAPAGVKSGRAAGAVVIACVTSHTVDQLKEAGAHYVVNFLTDVDLTVLPDNSLEVQVKNIL
ncbi:HAD-like domain-containing protein [Helicostylum pulchrum]|uniref:Uncharacterized protein n=1 Tax=Helicostylum pulchrum TaxID=562976 RepID=A0ABP9XXR9_9FUNG|nr:HAD-like domain-containing protein [Helicostylum pulchrum]